MTKGTKLAKVPKYTLQPFVANTRCTTPFKGTKQVLKVLNWQYPKDT